MRGVGGVPECLFFSGIARTSLRTIILYLKNNLSVAQSKTVEKVIYLEVWKKSGILFFSKMKLAFNKIERKKESF